jgi:SAM-dependent methyltransferase
MENRFVQQNHGDENNTYPELWKFLIKKFSIKSVLDVGCGLGLSTKFFNELGLYARGIEFYKPTIEQSPVKELIIEQDYELTSYTPEIIYDLAWAHEFVEHVDETKVNNFIDTFKKCKIIVMSHAVPNQGGVHHVNCKDDKYWIDILEEKGFDLDWDLSLETRQIAKQEKLIKYPFFDYYSPSGLVFFNKEI